MRRLLMFLLILYFLGKVPVTQWNNSTEEQKKYFMDTVADAYGKKLECQKGMLYAVNQGEEIYFFFECEKKIEEKEEKKERKEYEKNESTRELSAI